MKDYGTRIDKGIYLKKGKLGYRLVYPWKDEEGTHMKNVLLNGSWENFIKLFVLVSFILISAVLYMHDVKVCNYMIENICDFSMNITSYCSDSWAIFQNPDISDLNLGVIGNATT